MQAKWQMGNGKGKNTKWQMAEGTVLLMTWCLFQELCAVGFTQAHFNYEYKRKTKLDFDIP